MSEANNIIFPREFNRLVELGFIDSKYIINCDIDEEKDHLIEKIKQLEADLKVSNQNKNNFYSMFLKEKEYSKKLENDLFEIRNKKDIDHEELCKRDFRDNVNEFIRRGQ